MRVTPTVSSIANTTVNLGNGANGTILNQQVVDTTVLARDGETVAIGGLITRSDAKSENKIPWFGDLPLVGTAFRYRTQIKQKQELLVILTPRIVRSRAEAARILSEEARRMDWVLGDVVKMHGNVGMEPLFPPPPGAAGAGLGPQGPLGPLPCPGGVDGNLAPQALPLSPVVPPVQTGAAPGVPTAPPVMPPAQANDKLPTGPAGTPHSVPGAPTIPPGPGTLPPPAQQPVGSGPAAAVPPQDRPLAGLSTLSKDGATAFMPGAIKPSSPAGMMPAAAPGDPTAPMAVPALEGSKEDGKESERWRLFRRRG
jgi:general secretion pathway protein D